MLTLVTIAVAGVIGITRLANHVTTPKSEGNEGITVHSEVVSVLIHPDLFDLAQRPEDLLACQTPTGFRAFADKRGLEHAWYVITAKKFQLNGETIDLPVIRRPYEMPEPLYREFVDVLDRCAGRPCPDPLRDLSGVEVGIVPGRLRNDDPRVVVNELRIGERLTLQDLGH